MATTRKKRPVSYRGYRFRFVTIQLHNFFGYLRERIADPPTVIADEAKAIVDSLDLMQNAGGIGEVVKAM